MEVLRSSKFRLKLRRNAFGYLFIAPWLAGFIIFGVYPLFYSLYLSFTNYALRPEYNFVGLANYINLIRNDVFFHQSIRVTVHFVVIAVPLQLAFALFLALVLNTGIPGLKYFRAAYYLPALMGGSVAIAILWRQVFGAEGIMNDFLALIGLPESVTSTSWVANPDYAIYSLILLRIWQFGSPMIIFLAGLKQIPSELYEAASIDGANFMKKFRRITLPMLSPIILFNLIMQIISAFQTFTSAFIMGGSNQGAGGGVANSLLFYTIYLYRVGFVNFRMGTASAMAWMLLIALAVITFMVFRSSKSWVHYNE